MKIKKYLKKHPDLPEPVREVLREAVAFTTSGTGDDPTALALAVADMLAGKKKPAPVATAAATTMTYATVGAYPAPACARPEVSMASREAVVRKDEEMAATQAAGEV